MGKDKNLISLSLKQNNVEVFYNITEEVANMMKSEILFFLYKELLAKLRITRKK